MSEERRKILVITPRFPFDLWGACEQDRSEGIRFLTQLGFDVHVVTMCYHRHLLDVPETEKKWGVKITPILYSAVSFTKKEKLIRTLKRLLVPLYWDGAAHEFRRKEVQETVTKVIRDFDPSLVWVDSTYLWPLHHIVRSHGVPLIVRSVNYEPSHFLGKTKRSPIDWLKYCVKAYGERQNLRNSDTLFSITPKEKMLYESIDPTAVVANLPLRRLGSFLGKNSDVHIREKLNVCFMGSNYTVHHMLQGLRFVLDEVNPLLQERYPDTFTIHVFGGKVPDEIKNKEHKGVVIHGYVPDLDAFLSDMDIALSPSLSGEGMQQKVFEPIVRGIPTLTSSRALVGYPFYEGIHVLTADERPESFIEALGKLRDPEMRRNLSKNAVEMSRSQFSDDLIKEIIRYHIERLITKV